MGLFTVTMAQTPELSDAFLATTVQEMMQVAAFAALDHLLLLTVACSTATTLAVMEAQ